MRPRKPIQLLLAFFGDFLFDHHADPMPAPVLLDILEGAGVAPATTRATLNRMAARGLLSRAKQGRGIAYGLTERGREVLKEASGRVNRPRPFDSQGEGWTLVTFSVPEGQRTLRHRLRATLTWAGFAPLRDGLWVAPGAVDLNAALQPLARDIPPGALTGFLAHELEGYEMGASISSAWDLESIRSAHESFANEWTDPEPPPSALPALTSRIVLIADWLALLRSDPGLPTEYLGEDWPADRSTETFRARRDELEGPSRTELASRIN